MDQPRTASPRRSTRAIVLVASIVIGVLWVVVGHPFEGPVIWEITEYHGVHRYDILGLVPPLAALVWWVAAR